MCRYACTRHVEVRRHAFPPTWCTVFCLFVCWLVGLVVWGFVVVVVLTQGLLLTGNPVMKLGCSRDPPLSVYLAWELQVCAIQTNFLPVGFEN